MGMFLLGTAATSPTADAMRPDCSSTHDGCTYDWYNDYGNDGHGWVVTTCGDFRDSRYGSGGCG